MKIFCKNAGRTIINEITIKEYWQGFCSYDSDKDIWIECCAKYMGYHSDTLGSSILINMIVFISDNTKYMRLLHLTILNAVQQEKVSLQSR